MGASSTTMLVRFGIIVALLVSAQIATYIIQQYETRILAASEGIINISGRQRMLSQRTAFLVERLIEAEENTDKNAIRIELNRLIDLMSRSHQDLVQGNTELGLPAELSPDIQAIYFQSPLQLDSQVQQYLKALNRLLKMPNERLARENTDYLNFIRIAQNGNLLVGLEKIVLQHEKEIRQRIDDLSNILNWVLIGNVVIFIALWVMIFRPMAIRVKTEVANLTRLNDVLEQKVVDRTKEIQSNNAKLADRNEQLQAVLTTAVDGIISIDNKGIVQSFNPAAQRMFGYMAEEVVGANVRMLMPEPYQSEHDSYITHYRDTQQAKIIGIGREVSGKRKNGEIFPLDLAVSEMQVNEEQKFVGIVRDITERKQAEQEVSFMIGKLTRSNEELARFAYVASHDLREPLRMVTNFTAMLQKYYENKLDDKAQEYIQYAADGARRMQALIDDLLTYARLDAESLKMEVVEGQQVFEHVCTNLAELIHETGAVVDSDNLPTISTNPSRLVQLLQNLVANGIKYQAENNKPEIHVSIDTLDEVWQFAVQDNGIGIKPEYHKKIFEPFQRLHGKHEYSGTGIGLSVCRKIVDSLGGQIWLESEPGQGSTFYFTLPKQPIGTSDEKI